MGLTSPEGKDARALTTFYQDFDCVVRKFQQLQNRRDTTDLEKITEILGDDSQSAVIGARNQRAIDVLKNQLESGDKYIAIFYGVAHMPDMEERLLEQLDLVYLDTTWVDAWRLDTRGDTRGDR